MKVTIELDLASETDAAVLSRIFSSAAPETATAPVATEQGAADGGRRAGRKTSAPVEFVVYRPSGEKRAGYLHSADAVQIYIQELEAVKDKAELEQFAAHNMKDMSRLEKGHQAQVQVAIANKVEAIKKAQDEAKSNPTSRAGAPAVTDACGDLGGTPGNGASASGTGPNATNTASPSDPSAALLTEFFASPDPAAQPSTAPMTKDEFSTEMLALGKAMGGQEAVAWLTKEGYKHVSLIPQDLWATIVAKAKAHVAKLQEGKA